MPGFFFFTLQDFLKPSNLQTILINNRDVIEDRIGVTIVITTENICSSSPCERGRKCIPVVKPLENSSGKRGQLMSGFQRTFECFCLDGTKGVLCFDLMLLPLLPLPTLKHLMPSYTSTLVCLCLHLKCNDYRKKIKWRSFENEPF